MSSKYMPKELSMKYLSEVDLPMDIVYDAPSPVDNKPGAATPPPSNISELLQVVRDTLSLSSLATESPNGNDVANVLIAVLRKHKFWPALQVKKFYSNKNLVLLHNTYKRIDVSHFQTLYDECRSIVLDMSPENEQNIVVSYADQIPTTLSANQYLVMKNNNDICYEAFEGTVVTIYSYKGIWHFGTSSCPTVDSSRYFHPTNTHGKMLDEALAAILGVPAPAQSEFGFGVTTSDDVRKAFTHHLNPNRAYAFILVHHENKHVMDYTGRFGLNYAKLVHIIMRDRMTFVDIPINEDTVPELIRNGLIYPVKYESPEHALIALGKSNAATMNDINAVSNTTYGFIAIHYDSRKRFKVCDDRVVLREEFDLGNPNMWHNMLNVYIQNKPHYKIVDYQRDFCPTLELPKNTRGQDIAPTYIIHTVVCTMRDILYTHYRASTTFNKNSKKFYIQREVDTQLPQIIKFHMAQLRNIQVTTHNHAPITPQAIYHYLCHHQSIKNLRLLVKHFASNVSSLVTLFPPRTIECFVQLDDLLSA